MGHQYRSEEPIWRAASESWSHYPGINNIYSNLSTIIITTTNMMYQDPHDG
jgi:hypothetical protein